MKCFTKEWSFHKFQIGNSAYQHFPRVAIAPYYFIQYHCFFRILISFSLHFFPRTRPPTRKSKCISCLLITSLSSLPTTSSSLPHPSQHGSTCLPFSILALVQLIEGFSGATNIIYSYVGNLELCHSKLRPVPCVGIMLPNDVSAESKSEIVFGGRAYSESVRPVCERVDNSSVRPKPAEEVDDPRVS